MDSERRTLRQRAGDPVTFKHVVGALPVMAAALVWFASQVITRAEDAAAAHIEHSKQEDKLFRAEVQKELEGIREDYERLNAQFVRTESILVGKVDKLSELIMTGAIRVRRKAMAGEGTP